MHACARGNSVSGYVQIIARSHLDATQLIQVIIMPSVERHFAGHRNRQFALLQLRVIIAVGGELFKFNFEDGRLRVSCKDCVDCAAIAEVFYISASSLYYRYA